MKQILLLKKKLLTLALCVLAFISFNCTSVQEYEYQSTAEARFVKELDQCEMILQAFEYEELEKTPGRLQDFYDSTAGMNQKRSVCLINRNGSEF